MILHRLKNGWNTLKLVRVLLGVLVLYSSIAEHNTAGIMLGSLFTVFSLLTDGVCCTAGACSNPIQSKNNATPENIEYEELDNK